MTLSAAEGMRGPLQPGGLPTVTTPRHPHSYPQDPEPLKGGGLEPWGPACRDSSCTPTQPQTSQQGSGGTKGWPWNSGLRGAALVGGCVHLLRAPVPPSGKLPGPRPLLGGHSRPAPRRLGPARRQGLEGRLGASACWFPPGFWGERGGGLAGTGARLEPSVSQQSPPAPAPGKGPLASPPWEGGKGPQREEAASGFQGHCSACGPLCIHSSRAALGSHGGALRERKRPQLSWPQVHIFLRNKAGLQSHFENNSIKISREGTSLPPARNLPAHRLSCVHPGPWGLERAPGVVGGPHGAEPQPTGSALTLGVSAGGI